MSVRILLPGIALRLDRDRNDAGRILARSPRRDDLARRFPEAWIIDRPDHALRFRAHLPEARVREAFGPATLMGLNDEEIPVPAEREVGRRIDAALEALRDPLPVPARIPVLRSDLPGAWSPHRPLPSPLPERTRRMRMPLTAEEIDRLRLGSMPRDPHDKWHLFFEEPWLTAFRHWSGLNLARFELRGERLVRAVLPIPAAVTGQPRYEDEAFRLALGAVELLIGRPLGTSLDRPTGWMVYGPASVSGSLVAGLDPADLPVGEVWWDGPEARAVS